MAKTYTVELTAEQIKQLGLKIDPFERAEGGEYYYHINGYGQVTAVLEDFLSSHNTDYKKANYCTDEEIMKQRALHETLNRILWRFSMQNGGGEINWSGNMYVWSIHLCPPQHPKKYIVCQNYGRTVGSVHFTSKELAKQAIEEIVKPFIEEHPEFDIEGCCL